MSGLNTGSGGGYGASSHYLSDKGNKYLAHQNEHGLIDGKISAAKFVDLELSDATIVDFGAGAGNLLDALEARRKIAVEINPHARKLLAERGLEAYAELQELPTGTADFVISHHSLEHVPNPLGALKEIKRILRPGGTFRLYLPIDDWRTQKRYERDDIDHHLYTWTPQLIGNCLDEIGLKFDPADIRIVTHAWFPGYTKLYSAPFFDALCKAFSILRRRRQLVVTATKPCD